MEDKFTKSQSNKGTENTGLALLLTDARFQVLDVATKKHLLQGVGTSPDYGIQTFDAVMTPEQVEPITIANVDVYASSLKLIEMKTTRKSIKNQALGGFFFGATEREYAMARALGERYLFAFVVLNENNDYGRPFAALLTLDEVEHRTRSRRIQYQVNFRSTIPEDASDVEVVVFGSDAHIPRERASD